MPNYRILESARVRVMGEDFNRVDLCLDPGTFYRIKRIDDSSFGTRKIHILKNVGGYEAGKTVIVGKGHAEDWINRGLAAEVVK